MSCKVYSLDVFRRTKNKQSSLITLASNNIVNNTDFNFQSIIDMLSSIFGNDQPEGGVIYNDPVEENYIDAYGRGCIHNSIFQYHPKEGSNEPWNRPMPFPSDINKIYKAIEKNKGKTMYLGYKSDPLMWMDDRYKITKEIIRYATLYNVILIINTMSDLCAYDDYIHLIKEGKHIINMNMSLNDGNEELERRLSPGAPSLLRRNKAIEKLRVNGVEVTIQEFKTIEIKHKRFALAMGGNVGDVIKSGDKNIISSITQWN